jgi:hypothetical protein
MYIIYTHKKRVMDFTSFLGNPLAGIAMNGNDDSSLYYMLGLQDFVKNRGGGGILGNQGIGLFPSNQTRQMFQTKQIANHQPVYSRPQKHNSLFRHSSKKKIML